MKPLLSVLIVSWNAKGHLLNCLRSLYGAPPAFPFEVVVLDNGSTDGSPEMVRESFPEVVLLVNPRNVGLFARNLAVAAAQGEFLLFLDADVIVPPGALESMVRYAQANPSVGILGCEVRGPDGRVQISCGQYPTPLTELCYWTFLSSLFKRSERIPQVFHLWREYQPRRVKALSGVCLLTRREVAQAVGEFDGNFHCYLEDVEWCLRAGKRGFQIVYYPCVHILHVGGGSGALWSDAVLKVAQGPSYYFRKHYGAVAAGSVRLMQVVGLSVRVALFRLLYALSRNPFYRGKYVWNQRLLLANFGVLSSIPVQSLPHVPTDPGHVLFDRRAER